MTPTPGTLFDVALPDGFQYRPGFVTPDEERALVEEIARVPFSTFELRGVAARRRVAFFGLSYDAGKADTPAIPAFLLPLRARLADWAHVAPDAFEMALINQYPPGAPIGWHRDAPQYDRIAGVSLVSSCRMKFRPYVRPGTPAGGRRSATQEILLEPRSAYLMAGASRVRYEHHIPAVAALRYSITFRTLK